MNQMLPPTSILAVVKGRVELLEKHAADLKYALEHGGQSHTFDDVCKEVLRGELDIINNDTALMLVNKLHYPRYNVLHVFLAAGELDGVLALSDTLDDYARARDCSRLSYVGRKGWLKPLTQLGWMAPMTYMEKDLTHG